MSKRKQTPSLIDDLLTGKRAQEPAASSSPAPLPKVGPAPAPSPAPIQTGQADEKIKVTLYMSREVADSIDEARLLLLRLIRPESKHDVSRSAIVERAIQLALDELLAKGEASSLARALGGKSLDQG